jgi:hypothetical protein
MEAKGKKKWVIPGGHIPLQSTGREPDLVSQDRIAVLNAGSKSVKVKIGIFYTDHEPVNEYVISVKGQRLKKIRINDLINPFPITLETAYAMVIEAEEPVVVQFLRMSTGNKNLSIMGTIAFGTDI